MLFPAEMSQRIESPLITNFAANLKKYRIQNSFSQEELADRSGLDRTYVSGCERGIRNPSLKSLEKLALALSVSAYILLEENV